MVKMEILALYAQEGIGYLNISPQLDLFALFVKATLRLNQCLPE